MPIVRLSNIIHKLKELLIIKSSRQDKENVLQFELAYHYEHNGLLLTRFHLY
jgi:hypothetical protein